MNENLFTRCLPCHREAERVVRMRILRHCVLLFWLLCLLPLTAWAQTPLEFDLRLGPSITLGDFSDFAGTGVFLSGTVLAKVAPAVSVGLEIGGSVGHENGPIETSIFQLTPVVRAQAPLGGNGIGYLLIGAGYYHTEYDISSGGFGSGSVSYDDFGINLGAGLLFAIAPQVSLGFDIRYHHLFETGSDPEILVPGLLITFTPRP